MASTPILTTRNSRDERDVRRRAILADVRDGLARRPRELSPKYFYDERGSRLFEEITHQPEYYLTRAEREILVERASDIVADVMPRTLVELGAGSAAKTRILLDALVDKLVEVTYVPVDVSEDFLANTERALTAEYPSLRVSPVVADIGATLDIPPHTQTPVMYAFLGSTIGNFNRASAVALLRRIRGQMRPADRLLLGTDLRKDSSILNAAYNDAAGVTAEFNRNMLRVLNAELGADFDVERFTHRAAYDERASRIEMHLVADGDQTVHVPGMPAITIRDGESIRTELSHKYDRASVDALARAASLRVSRWFTDRAGRFALSLIEPIE